MAEILNLDDRSNIVHGNDTNIDNQLLSNARELIYIIIHAFTYSKKFFIPKNSKNYPSGFYNLKSKS